MRDLVHSALGPEAIWFLHITFLIWLLHAVMNQISQKSTATLVVEGWRCLLGFAQSSTKKADSFIDRPRWETCVVCDLLRQREKKSLKMTMDMKPSDKPESNPALRRSSRHLLAAIFTLQIGSFMYAMILFMVNALELGPAAGPASFGLLLFLHEGWVMLQHGNVLLNPFCQQLDRNYGVSMLQKRQHWVIAGVLVMYWSREVLSMLLCLPSVTYTTQVAILISSTYHLVKMYSICMDAQRKSSPTLGIMRLLIDHWHFDTPLQLFISALRGFLQGTFFLVGDGS